jgi:alkanesulfonate monooxygenase SsuD/methylene tetrahydromethanopterin reductase-like flavin-dependent oxidoreductase (luciferase family)
MARHGIKGVIGGGAAGGGAPSKTVLAWQDALARHGRETELGTDLVIGLMFHIADTEEQAIREATPFFEEWMKMFAPLGFVPGLSDAQVGALADRSQARHAALPTLSEAVKSGAWLVGPPEHIVERLQELQTRYPGLEEVHVGQVVGTDQQVIVDQLERFARDVMPVFKPTRRLQTA